ncbi:hypothetical protein ACJ73_07678 [Blastomyces percursus]|uniref:Uncharacterized protein n=1 Tax=Blastomyces percursus TaxID=1658174 RepID=A0A1J9QXR9_9EURO|nr:hypothetical protein ACJ73_07678 [Blastomyces percursus]
MKPISLLRPLLLVNTTLAAPASPNIRSLRSSIGISKTDTDLDNLFSHTSSYQTQSFILTGSRQVTGTYSRGLSTRQSIQELVDIGYPDKSSSLLPEPYPTIQDKPLPTTSRTHQGRQFGSSAGPTSSSYVSLTSAGFTKEFLAHLPISTVPGMKSRIISNIPALTTSNIASSSSSLSSSLPTPYLATLPRATMTATASTHDNNLFTMLKTMDSIDEFIIWVSDRRAWAVAFVICALVLLFLVSIVIVEVGDFACAFVSARLASWGWRRRRPVIHLSGPERRLIAVPTAESDSEKRAEINYGTCD